ncbi:hypothetical protein ACFGVS_29435 [Mucilaginibacter sp. AW1-7]|uniref:hypothetical protein n=1 Tax=Mucilaginibacter sp. AW1-7 TaxID=3349874 RepID=UPI003F73F3F6
MPINHLRFKYSTIDRNKFAGIEISACQTTTKSVFFFAAKLCNSHLRWKEGLNAGYSIEKGTNQMMNFQAPLSGEAEERVAGAASPGES